LPAAAMGAAYPHNGVAVHLLPGVRSAKVSAARGASSPTRRVGWSRLVGRPCNVTAARLATRWSA